MVKRKSKYGIVLFSSISMLLLLASIQSYGIRLSPEEYIRHKMNKIRCNDDTLRSIYERQLKTEYQISRVKGEAYYESRDEFFSKPRNIEEQQYIVKSIDDAYNRTPKDWDTITLGLYIAVVGINDNHLIQRCIEILKNIKSIPDNSVDVSSPNIISATTRYLIVKSGAKHIDLLVDCVDPDVVGVRNENDTRNIFRAKVINELNTYLAPDYNTILKIFKNLSEKYPKESIENKGSYEHQIACMCHDIARFAKDRLTRKPSIYEPELQ